MTNEALKHFIIVNIQTWCINKECPDLDNCGIMEFCALTLNSESFKLESLYHDYCKVDKKRIGISTKPTGFSVNPEIVSECPDDLLKSFTLWIEGLSHKYSKELDALEEDSCVPDIQSIHESASVLSLLTMFAPSKPLKKFLMLTWGSYQFQEFVQENGIELPSFCKMWCNIKEIYRSHFNAVPSHIDFHSVEKKLNVYLDTSKSGLALCINIAKIAHGLLRNGAVLKPTVFLGKLLVAINHIKDVLCNFRH